MKYVVKLNQRVYEVEIERADAAAFQTMPEAKSPVLMSATAPATAPATAVSAAAEPAAVSGETNIQVECPMPGKVLSISVSVGQRVNAGECLMIVEAMKMENEIVAPQSGTVKQILVSQGTTVDTGDILTVLI